VAVNDTVYLMLSSFQRILKTVRLKSRSFYKLNSRMWLS